MAAQEKMPEVVKISQEEMDAFLDRLGACSLNEQDKNLVKGSLRAMVWLHQTVEAGRITIHKLKSLFRGFRSEKRSAKKAQETGTEAEDEGPADTSDPETDPGLEPLEGAPSGSPSLEKCPVKGHGRRGAASYIPSEKIDLLHEALKAGDLCPDACGGRLYTLDPGIFLQIQGQPMAKVVQYSLEKLRCALCGSVFTADLPEVIKKDGGKYDFCFKALLVCQKYFVGVPFYRQEAFQEMLDVTLADSTQWDVIVQVAEVIEPLLPALEKALARGEVIYGDDTKVKILEVMKQNAADPSLTRKGTYTSAFYGETGPFRVALYYSSRLHAGENLVSLLKERPPDLPKFIHMSDALAANRQESIQDLLYKAFCLVHARRYFEELLPFYPQESRFYIDQIAVVYKHEKEVKEKGLSAAERLAYHQAHSGPVMAALQTWLVAQAKLFEPSSSLAKAIQYSLTHWAGLTLFLRQAGAPLDNNPCERLIKLPIRLRKNALFYKTERGARIGGLMMSVLQTCRLNKENPMDYLVACQRYGAEVARDPDAWLPWAYQKTLQTLEASSLRAA